MWRNCGDYRLGMAGHLTEAAVPVTTRDMEIVLAEDEANLRSALCHAFGREAWTVRDFPDGLAAWEYLESGPGAGERLLVLDIMMPRMDGLELCRRMRQIDSQLPILFLSSRDEEFDRVLGLELGADDYLCKPFSVRELVTRIKVLHRRAYGRRDSAPGESGPAMAAKGAMAGPVAARVMMSRLSRQR